jgi:hypothetical protein
MNIHVKGPAMQECLLIDEYVDVRNGEFVEERYYFGRPWSKSDYVIVRRRYLPVLTQAEKQPDDDWAF